MPKNGPQGGPSTFANAGKIMRQRRDVHRLAGSQKHESNYRSRQMTVRGNGSIAQNSYLSVYLYICRPGTSTHCDRDSPATRQHGRESVTMGNPIARWP